jgi:alpha-tubulin suppressor-like RCC1 family protein
VQGLESGVIDIAAGGPHACALLEGGEVKCWSYGINYKGCLGRKTHLGDNLKIPQKVEFQ